MPEFPIYIDTTSGQTVAGISVSSLAPLPQFVQGDTLSLRLYLLQRTSTYPVFQPFTVMSLAGLTLQMAIGDKVGNATNYYATQFAWTIAGDNQSATAQLNLNTAAITTLIGSAASANTTLHVEYLNGGLPSTVLETAVTIQAAVIKAGGAPAVPPGQTALSAETANATFLKRVIQGAFTLVSPDGTKQASVYIDNDGTFHCDPIS